MQYYISMTPKGIAQRRILINNIAYKARDCMVNNYCIPCMHVEQHCGIL